MAVEKFYVGQRRGDGGLDVIVETADGRVGALPLRFDLINHSPTGFECGYGGSGPAQLALAMAADATGDDDLAIRAHQHVKSELIASLSQSRDWRVTAGAVVALVDEWRRRVTAE